MSNVRERERESKKEKRKKVGRRGAVIDHFMAPLTLPNPFLARLFYAFIFFFFVL